MEPPAPVEPGVEPAPPPAPEGAAAAGAAGAAAGAAGAAVVAVIWQIPFKTFHLLKIGEFSLRGTSKEN